MMGGPIMQQQANPNPEEGLFLDWSLLAGALEDDFKDGGGCFDLDDEEWDDDGTSISASITRSDLGWSVEGGEEDDDDDDAEGNAIDHRDHINEAMVASFVTTPRQFVTRTCRSELVDALLSAQGDVTDQRFLKAVEILSKLYESSNDYSKELADTAVERYLNGTWLALSRPSYTGCLGKNEYNEYLYTLGKMSFNMFKPGHLQCSVQHTLNKVKFVGSSMEDAPAAIPWSLRRELAMFDANADAATKEEDGNVENDGTTRQELIQRSTLRSYE